MDKHALVNIRVITQRPKSPWFNDDITAAKREKCCSERKWLKSRLEVDRQLFVQQCENECELINQAITQYNREKIENSDQRNLFRVVDGLMYKPTVPIIPTYEDHELLANRFSSYFATNISDIRCMLDEAQNREVVTSPFPEENICEYHLISFNPTTEEVGKIIMNSPTKSCCIDPIPNLDSEEKNVDVLLPCITSVVNMSMSQGMFPSKLKSAIVTILLKKPSLHCENLKNYKASLNLPLLSKIIERFVQSRIMDIHHHTI